MSRDRLILAVLCGVLPVAFWPGSTSYEALKLLVVLTAAGGLLLATAWRVLRRTPLVLPRGPEAGPWFALLLVILLSGAFGADTGRVLRTFVLTAAWIVVLGAVASAVVTPGHLRRILAALAAGAVITSLYGLAQIWGLLPGPDPTLGVPPGISTFGNENQTAGYAAVAFWPALALALLHPVGRGRILPGLAVLVLAACVFAAEATGPRLAVAVAGAVIVPARLLVRLGRPGWVPVFCGGAVVVGAVIVVLGFARVLAPGSGADGGLPGPAGTWLEQNNGNIRRTDWLVAWHLFKLNSPGFVGAGNYQVLWPEARAALTALPEYAPLAEHVPVATRAHNEYLQGLAEFGVMGAFWVVATAGGLILVLRRRWDRVSAPENRVAFLALCGAVVTIAVHALVSFPLHLPAPAFLLAAVLGLLGSGALESGSPPQRTVVAPRGVAGLPAAAGIALLVVAVSGFAGDLNVARGQRAYTAGRFDEALAHLDRGAALTPWPGDEDLYRGLTLAALGRDTAAGAAYAASLRHAPRFEGLLGLAEARIEQGEFIEALALLARVDSCRPTNQFRHQSRYLRGMVFLRQDRLEAAQREFSRLLAAEPRHVRALLARGYVALRAGGTAAARQDYGLARRVIAEDLAATADPGEEVRLRHLQAVARRAWESLP